MCLQSETCCSLGKWTISERPAAGEPRHSFCAHAKGRCSKPIMECTEMLALNRLKQVHHEFKANLCYPGRGWKAAQWSACTRSWAPSPAPSEEKQVQTLSPRLLELVQQAGRSKIRSQVPLLLSSKNVPRLLEVQPEPNNEIK